MAPLFSIIVACYNHENFVKESVGSALHQTYLDREIIAVDDGSSDSTAMILESFGESIRFARLPDNRGAGNARNQGASLATGRYLVFLDGDDVLMPWALEVYHRLIAACDPKLILGKCAKCVRTTPAVGPGVPDAIEFVQYPDFLSKDRSWVYNTSALIVDRATFLSAGGWSTDIFYQDIQDLLSKLGIAGKTVLTLEPATVWYRMHSTNAVRSTLPFLKGIYALLDRARDGAYPGGSIASMRRQTWFGGLIFYWTKEALRSGFYREAFTMLARNGWLLPLAIARRSTAWIAGRRSTETLPIEQKLQESLDWTTLKPRRRRA